MDQYLEQTWEQMKRGEIDLTAVRIAVGSASWREAWAYRLPFVLGWLHRDARTARLTGRDPRQDLAENPEQLAQVFGPLATMFGEWCQREGLLPNEHALLRWIDEGVWSPLPQPPPGGWRPR